MTGNTKKVEENLTVIWCRFIKSTGCYFYHPGILNFFPDNRV
jgi:hypothetical protein